MKQIIFFDVNDNDINFFKKYCFDKYKIIFIKQSLKDFSEINEKMKETNIISCFTISQLSEDVLKMFPKLELILLRCVGFNHVDINYCKANGIKVLNAKGYGNRTVAEFAIGLLFDVSRKISRAYFDIIDEKKEKNDYFGTEFFGKTVGVIGVGAIGSEFVKISHGIGMKVLGYDVVNNNELIEKYNLKYTSLNFLLENSDFISIHAPSREDNYHLINSEKFSLMKENAILINTARGELIDTKAMYKALSFGTIRGAGLDVLECEDTLKNKNLMFDMDYLDKTSIKQILLNHEITKLDNVVVTPHIAYDTEEAKKRIREITIDNLNSYIAGEIKNSVY